jgi:hypothetical protein
MRSQPQLLVFNPKHVIPNTLQKAPGEELYAFPNTSRWAINLSSKLSMSFAYFPYGRMIEVGEEPLLAQPLLDAGLQHFLGELFFAVTITLRARMQSLKSFLSF